VSAGPLLAFPLEWAALALLVAGCLFWERAGLTGLGVEGCFLSAMAGLVLGYEWTGYYPAAFGIAAGAAVLFGTATGGLLLAFRTDPAVGAFALSLVPAAGITLMTRSGPFRLWNEVPAPGLIEGTPLDASPARDLLLAPAFWSAPLLLLLGALVLLRTPFGLRLRAYGETPALAVQDRARPVAYRILGAALGAVFALPAAAIEMRAHPDTPPLGLGLLALACAVSARWAFLPGILLAAGPAFLRAARPYAAGAPAAEAALDAAPFLLGLLYLLLLARRSLRLATPGESRLDPDVL
jgi:simple sugar transport system permease protein